MAKKIMRLLRGALIGLVVGSLTTLGLSALWLRLLPVVDRTGQGSGFLNVLLVILGIVAPVSAVGGLIGGAIPKEGGTKNQILYAAIICIFVTIPFALFVFWYTGF